MELDIIEELLAANPEWLRPFPVVWDVEYYVSERAKHLGRGDLIACTPEHDRFLVVELKRTLKNRRKLLEQMDFYQFHLKRTMPTVGVDCAAVAGGRLIAYRRDLSTPGREPLRRIPPKTHPRKRPRAALIAPPPAFHVPLGFGSRRSVVQHR